MVVQQLLFSLLERFKSPPNTRNESSKEQGGRTGAGTSPAHFCKAGPQSRTAGHPLGLRMLPASRSVQQSYRERVVRVRPVHACMQQEGGAQIENGTRWSVRAAGRGGGRHLRALQCSPSGPRFVSRVITPVLKITSPGSKQSVAEARVGSSRRAATARAEGVPAMARMTVPLPTAGADRFTLDLEVDNRSCVRGTCRGCWVPFTLKLAGPRWGEAGVPLY